jgi:hypothetical protein
VSVKGAQAAACRFFSGGVAVLALFALVGCASARIQRLTDERFPARPKDATVRLYINKVQQPHREIAFIDSHAVAERTEANREKQLLEIREAARKLGADAVHDIRPLTLRVQGLIPDKQVPFKAFKQGRQKLYFMRGVAIVYTEKSAPEDASFATPPPPGERETPVPVESPPLLPPPPVP